MKENKKQQYLTPMVERLEARVERGFEGSLAPTGSNEDPRCGGFAIRHNRL